jgi:hypothetical protein
MPCYIAIISLSHTFESSNDTISGQSSARELRLRHGPRWGTEPWLLLALRLGNQRPGDLQRKTAKKTKITMDNYGKLEICIFLSLNFGFDSYNLKGFNPHRMDI